MAKENNVELRENNTPALLGFIFSFIGCLTLPGLILSIIGLVEADKYKNDRKGFAIAGIVISAVYLVFISVFVLASGS